MGFPEIALEVGPAYRGSCLQKLAFFVGWEGGGLERPTLVLWTPFILLGVTSRSPWPGPKFRSHPCWDHVTLPSQLLHILLVSNNLSTSFWQAVLDLPTSFEISILPGSFSGCASGSVPAPPLP